MSNSYFTTFKWKWSYHHDIKKLPQCKNKLICNRPMDKTLFFVLQCRYIKFLLMMSAWFLCKKCHCNNPQDSVVLSVTHHSLWRKTVNIGQPSDIKLVPTSSALMGSRVHPKKLSFSLLATFHGLKPGRPAAVLSSLFGQGFVCLCMFVHVWQGNLKFVV